MIRYLYIYVWIALLSLGGTVIRAQRLSPMAQGRWAKISVNTTGLHRLSEGDLKRLGFERPERVRIWGYGGNLLPEQIALLRGHQLREIPTLLEGNTLYFYGEGTTSWHYLATSRFFAHTTNHYTTKGYYLLSEGETPMRMPIELAQTASSTSEEAARGTSFVLGEEDSYSLSKSGRKLYGQSLQVRPQISHTLSLPNAESVRLRFAYMAYPTTQDATLEASIDGKPYAEASITLADIKRIATGGSYKVYGVDRVGIGVSEIPITGEQLRLGFELSPSGYPAHMDYYELNVRQRLRLSSSQLLFSRPLRSDSPHQWESYQLEGVRGAMLLKLNEGMSSIVAHNIDSDAVSLRLQASDDKGAPQQYLLTNLAMALTPELHGTISNQNLLGSGVAADLLIITTSVLRGQANRLKTHYEEAGYRVEVATQEEVFNEFNGGTPDATAYRLWARYHYDLHRASHPGTDIQLQLLLVGDAAYDNRKLTQDWQMPLLKNTEFLLSYQSVASLDLSSYTSDDYFGVLQDEQSQGTDSEGAARYPELKNLAMDIGVGRLPVRTEQEARSVIDKIIRYERGPQEGIWKMKTAFVADNGDGNSHTTQSIEISNRLEAQVPALELTKIYMATYPREQIGGRTTVPGAHRALMEALREGVLIANYNGHGGPKSWADEQVLSINDIQNFSYKHLPLWITATCDFAGFDAPTNSAGEEILLHPTSGGIALLSTTRVVWDIPNQLLNMAILKELFTPGSDGKYRPLGLVVRDAKNALRLRSTPENRLNFALLGSPLLRLPLPPTAVQVSSIAGTPVLQGQPARLHALERATLEGYIQTPQGDIDGNFSGRVTLTIYDGEEELQTIDNFSRYDAEVRPARYRTYRNVIYTGYAKVDQGRFTTHFDIPKDVAYSGLNGRISLYALDPSTGREAIGLSNGLIITPGSGNATEVDSEPPTIHSITLSGRDAYRTPHIGRSTLLGVVLSDRSGINLSTAGLGHRIRLTINGETPSDFDLSKYYTPLEHPKGFGEVRFLIKDLREGVHSARLEVWDIHNNATRADFSFVVEERLAPSIERLELHPSPIVRGQSVSLLVTHDLVGNDLVADLAIYDVVGQLLWERKQTKLIGSEAASYTLRLTGSDLPQLSLWPRGTYILRLSLGAQGGAVAKASTKFVIQ